MSSKNDNLFLDSDEDDDGNDTDDLLATAAASSTTKKKLGSKSKSKSKAADNDSDDNDNDDSDEDLFADSDDEGDDDDESDGVVAKKKKGTKGKKQLGRNKNKNKKKLGKASQKANMSKKDKMEALARKRQRESEKKSKNKSDRSSADSSDGKNNKGGDNNNKDSGYDSADSYNSATYQRTKEDDDFIDKTGEDEDALKEYYAEQHFDDERPTGSDSEEDDEEGGHKKKKQRKGSSNQKQSTSVDALSQDDIQNKSDNPIVQAVLRMKKKKQVKLDEDQIEFEVKEFLRKMGYAADQDDLSIKNKTPATQKILMLSEVMQMLTKVDWQQKLLDEDLLMICKRWIEPLPNGKLGNITVRQRILETIGRMRCGTESGITPQLLKRSNFGKVVMQLYMHPDETPQMKTLHKKLIDQWSRHIFNKTSNMKDLSNVRRGESSMMLGAATSSTAYSNNAHLNRSLIKTEEMNGMRGGQDLGNILAGNRKEKYSLNNQGPQGSNRVRVPMSKGFHFTKRPEMRKIDATQKLEGARGNLNKTMMKRKQRTSGGKKHTQGRSVQMSADGKGLNR